VGLTRTRDVVVASTLGLLTAVVACGLGDGTLEELDPAAVPEVVTYSQHIQPRMEYYCVSCHNPDGPLGNAGGWDLSSYLLVRAAYRSIERAALTERSMPPGGARRLTAEDAAIFRRWRDSGFLERP
jgi:mono/diheme cytochrome c family protein